MTTRDCWAAHTGGGLIRGDGIWHALAAVLCLTAAVGASGVRAADGFVYPVSVAAAPDATLYVADRMLPGVWKVRDGQASVFSQGRKQFRTPLNAIRTVAVAPDGSVFVGDSATREVYRLEADGTPTPLTNGRIGIPVDIAIDQSGQLFVSDLETQRIWKLPAAGGDPQELVQLAAPRGLFVDAEDRLWAIAASGEAPLVRVTAEGAVEPVVRTRAFEFPHDVVVNAAGTAFVSDNYARCIWQVSPAGEVTKLAAEPPLNGPVGLAAQAEGVLIADPRAKAIFQLDAAGTLTTVAAAVATGDQAP